MENTKSSIPTVVSNDFIFAEWIISILPDPLKSKAILYKGYLDSSIALLPPKYSKLLPVLIIILVLSPQLFLYSIFIGFGFCLGFALGVPTVSPNEAVARWRVSKSIGDLTVKSGNGNVDTRKTEPMWSVVPNARPRDVKVCQILAKPASPAIEEAIKRLLDLFLRDYILQWYTPINYSKCSDFPDLIHDGVRSTIITLGRFVKRHRPAEAFLTISDVFVTHMREYRAFEASSMTISEYLTANPSSPFSRYSSIDKVRNRLRIIGHYLVEHLVPLPDRVSPILAAFSTEIAATSLLESLVEVLADPDRLNQNIVSLLMDLASTQAKQDVHNVEKGVGLNPMNTQKRPKRTDGETDEIYVKVVEAKRLPILGQNGVYCAILCGSASHKTRKVASESNPIWLQGFNIYWNKNSSKGVNGVVVDVYNVNNLKKDDLIGSVFIPHKKLIPNKYTKQWYTVESDPIAKMPAHTAELFLEVMYISTNAIDKFSDNQADPSYDATISTTLEPGTGALPSALIEKAPLTPADLDPRSLTLKDIFTKNQALLEFMTFLEGRPGGASLVHFFIMADNYRQFSCLDATVENMRSDGEALLAVFFGPKAQYPLSVPGYPNLGSELETEVKTSPSPNVFIGVQELVLDEMQSNHFNAFKESDIFKRYLKEVEATVNNVVGETSGHDHGKNHNSNSSMNSTDQTRNLDNNRRSRIPVGIAEKCSHSGPPSSNNVLVLAGLASGSPELDAQVWGTRTLDEIASPTRAIRLSNMSLDEDDLDQDRSASLIEHLESDQAAQGTDFLVAAVAGLREQLMIVDDIMQKTSTYEVGKLAELSSTRVSLQSQISELVDMIDADSVLESNGTTGNRVNLQNIRIKVYDASDDREPVKLGLSLASRGSKMLYTIQVERRDGTAGWVITRTYSDFVTFEAVLLKAFPKMAKMPLPPKPRGNSRAAAKQLSRELETWFNVIVSDAAMCESAPLQSFLKPESVFKEEQKGIATEIRDSVLKTIKGAGSVLKKVAVEASNALDNILNDMEDDARGVSRRNTFKPSKETPFSETRNTLATESPLKGIDNTNMHKGKVNERLAAVGNKHKGRPLDPNDLPNTTPSLRTTGGESSIIGTASSEMYGSASTCRQESPAGYSACEEDAAAINANSAAVGLLPDGLKRSQEGLRRRKSSDISTLNSTAPSLSATRLSSSLIDSQPMTIPPPQKGKQRDAPPAITDDELELVLDCFFAALEEAFALSDPSQWIRQKGLHVAKSLLRRAYSATLTSCIQKNLSLYMSEEAAVYYLDELREYLWPDDKMAKPPVTRTDEEIQDTKAAAKHLLVNSGTLPTGGIQQIVGRLNTVAGITRVFNMLQNKELNRVLVVELLDALVYDIVVGTVEA